MISTKIRDCLFFMISFALIFNNIPKAIQLNFIGGAMATQLALYPLIAGLIYTLYCEKKYGNIFVEKKIFTCFSFIYLSIMLVSMILGLIQYPFYDEILNGPVTQIQKFSLVTSVLSYLQIQINKDDLVLGLMVIRIIKGLFLSYIWNFGMAYLVFCWYRNDWEQGFNILLKGILCSLFIVIIYSIFELHYFFGGALGKSFLEHVNPYVHAIRTEHNWWPPLLWESAQMRSVFPEPSHLGNYLSVVIIALWLMMLRKKTLMVGIMGYSLFIFIVFLSQARTAYAMFLGTTLLIIMGLILGYRIHYYKVIATVLGVTVGMFLFSTECINLIDNVRYSKQPGTEQNVLQNDKNSKDSQSTATEVLDKNFSSIFEGNKRSNGARYALIKAHFRIGMEHPILGTGTGLNDLYTKNYFNEAEKRNTEVQMWINNQQKSGVLRYPIGAMNEYLERFSANGLVGLLVFLYPFFWLIHRIIKLLRTQVYSEKVIMLFIAIISSLVAGANGSLNVYCVVWLLLGLGYAMCWSVKAKNE